MDGQVFDFDLQMPVRNTDVEFWENYFEPDIHIIIRQTWKQSVDELADHIHGFTPEEVTLLVDTGNEQDNGTGSQLRYKPEQADIRVNDTMVTALERDETQLKRSGFNPQYWSFHGSGKGNTVDAAVEDICIRLFLRIAPPDMTDHAANINYRDEPTITFRYTGPHRGPSFDAGGYSVHVASRKDWFAPRDDLDQEMWRQMIKDALYTTENDPWYQVKNI